MGKKVTERQRRKCHAPLSLIGAIIWKENHSTINQPCTRVLISDQGVKRLVRRVAQEPRTTWKKLHKDSEKAGTYYRQCTPQPPCTLTPEGYIVEEKACLKLDTQYLEKPVNYWENGAFWGKRSLGLLLWYLGVLLLPNVFNTFFLSHYTLLITSYHRL